MQTNLNSIKMVINSIVYSSLLLTFGIGVNGQLQCPDDILTDPLPFGETETTQAVTWDDPSVPPEYTLTFQSHMPGIFPVGISIVTYRYQVTGRNDSLTCSFRITVQSVDTEPPVIANCPTSPIIAEYEVGQGHAVARWREPNATDNSGQVVLVEKNMVSGKPIYVGSQSVVQAVYEFQDSSQNSAFCSFDIRIQEVDTTPPVIRSCPSIIVKKIPLYENGTFVSIETPLVEDNSGHFSVVIDPDIPNNYFSTGLTKLTYIYTDPSGNPATCQVNVHVIESDLTPPEIEQCPSSFVFGVKPGNNQAFIYWPPAKAVDNSGFFTTYAPTKEGLYSVGSIIEVTYNFCDLAENCAECSFIITVEEDNEVPTVFRCPTDDIFGDLPSNETHTTVSWEEPFAEDNTFIAHLIQTHYPDNSFSVGNTTVEYVFIDSAGNNASCKFRVVVRHGPQSPDSSTGSRNDTIVVAVIICITIIVITVFLVVAFVVYLRYKKEENLNTVSGGVSNEGYTDLITRRPLPSIKTPKNIDGDDGVNYVTPMPN